MRSSSAQTQSREFKTAKVRRRQAERTASAVEGPQMRDALRAGTTRYADQAGGRLMGCPTTHHNIRTNKSLSVHVTSSTVSTC